MADFWMVILFCGFYMGVVLASLVLTIKGDFSWLQSRKIYVPIKTDRQSE